MIKNLDKRLIVILAVFLVTVLIYFLPIPINFKICFPLAVFAIASLFTLPWQMCVTLWASCLGDLFGGMGNFMLQMSCFTVAQISLILFLLVQFNGINPKGIQQAIALVACLLIFNSAVYLIVPFTSMGIERTGVIIYIIVVSLMSYFAIMQWNGILAIAATLFIFSNYVLGWNKFVNPVIASDYLIMVSYYLAQMFFFIGAYQNTKKWKMFAQIRREARLAAASKKDKKK